MSNLAASTVHPEPPYSLGCTFGEVLYNYDDMRYMLYIALEAAQVMEAKGLVAVDMERYHPTVAHYIVITEAQMYAVGKACAL